MRTTLINRGIVYFMKYTARTSKIKSIVVSIAACVALLVCALFSLGTGIGRQSSGETGSNDIRFVQVAAGEDFAIGLTAYGDLYGWSLREGRTTKGDANAQSLGYYYTNTPTKIDVTFFVGPGNGQNPIPSSNRTEYYKELPNERIVQIAATRNTAAFITEGNRIYTWGRDGSDYYDVPYGNIGGDYVHSLLLRNPDGTSSPWYAPYIINYNYYPDSLAFGLKRIHPYNMTNMSIAGGEYNYIIVYVKSNSYCTYVWGSEMYAVPNGDTTDASSQYNNLGSIEHVYARFQVFNTGLSTSDGSNRLTAVAGGYTVGYNDVGYTAGGGTSLSLRGKNFITSGTVTKSGTGNDYNMVQTVKTTTGSGTAALAVDSSAKALNAIIGAKSHGAQTDGAEFANDPNNADGYYGRQASPSGGPTAYTIGNNSVGTTVYASDGTTALGGTAFKAVHNAVSLGNDIGYGISGGMLYAWGDNSQGQLGNNSSGNNSTDPTNVFGGSDSKRFVTVAAGKQLSGPAKPFNATNTLVAISGDTTYKFNDGTADLNGGTENPNNRVTNAAEYITGAITTDGDLWVWSNVHKTPEQIHYGNKSTNNNNSFVAVYSGYGNYLFAVTKLGKLVQIEATTTGYNQIIHDKFNNGANDIVNWEITDKTNSVRFTVPTPTAAVPEPALGSMTFYVGSGSASQASVMLNDRAPTEESTTVNYADNSLIKSNAVCDVYRILDPDRDTSIGFVDTTGTGSRAATLSAEELTPKFRFKGASSDIRPAERANLFDFAFVYSATDGAGIRITPKRATKGTVTMEFYVARYDCAANFSVTGSGDGATVSDSAVYYDYQKCTVEFTVDNTAAYVEFDDFAGVRPEVDGQIDYSAKPQGNSLIPLLDPNNENNNKYSIALQDVTTGVKALVRYLQGLDNDAGVDANNNELYKAILGEMRSRDLGFPDSRKIASGNLEYYLGNDQSGTAHNRNNAHDKYNDEYQYLFADRDTDLILFSANTPVTVSGSGVEGTINPIKITIDITSSINATKLENLSTDFLNIYGLYNFTRGTRTTDSGEVNTFSFMYNTVLFTARGSTNRIRYAESGDVATYITTNASNNWARSSVRVSEFLGNSATYDPNVTGVTIPAARQFNSVMSVFAQTTLRLSQSKMTGQGNVVYGDSQSANSYTLSENYIRDKGFRVGTTKTIDLSEFFDFTDNNSIHFSYNNQFNDFSAFNRQFYDELNPTNNVVILSQNKIEITPTTTRPIYFTVTIQRFFDTNKTFSNNNEKITIVVNIPTVTDFTLAKSNASTSFNISAPVTIDLFGRRNNNANAFNEDSLLSEILDSTYTGVMSITDFATTNPSVASAVRTSGTTTAITVTPGTSGKATIMFVVSVFGKTLPMQLSFNVAGITPVAGTIELSDVKSVYVSTLLTEIRAKNSFVSGVATGYNIITTDIDENGKPAAIQFYDSNGELVTENGGKPRFVGNVRFTDTDTENPRIRLEINDNASWILRAVLLRIRNMWTAAIPFFPHRKR